MVVIGRRKSIGLFIAFGAGLISVIILLYVGGVFLNWRTGALLVLGVLLLAAVIAGVVLNTFFLVREIRRNEQHDAFINAVTHELKTPVASIRLYLETLQSRLVDDAQRAEFYRIMLEDSDRLLETIEQVLRTGRISPASRKPNRSRLDLGAVVEDCVAQSRKLKQLPPEALTFQAGPPLFILADMDEVRAAVSNLIDNAVKYSGKDVRVSVETAVVDQKYASVRVHDHGPGIRRPSSSTYSNASIAFREPRRAYREPAWACSSCDPLRSATADAPGPKVKAWAKGAPSSCSCRS